MASQTEQADQNERSGEDLEHSLRAEFERHLDEIINGLQHEIERVQTDFREAFTRFTERLTASRAEQSRAPLASAVSTHLQTAHRRGAEAAAADLSRQRAARDMALLKAAVDEINSQRTQAEILTSLVNRAASFAPRVAFFVIKNERAIGWRARGFEGTIGDDAVREISLPLSSDTLLSEVARSRAAWSGTPEAHAEDGALVERFGAEIKPQRLIAVPLVARDKAVAILYGDSSDLEAEAINLEAIETLVRVAAMTVELRAAKRPPSAFAASSSAAPQTSSQQAAPSQSVGSQSATRAAPSKADVSHAPSDASTASAATEQHASSAASHASSGAEQAAQPHETSASPAADEFSMPPMSAVPEPSSAHTAAPQSYDIPLETVGASPETSSETPGAAQTNETSESRGYEFAAPAATTSPISSPLGSRRYGADADLPIQVSDEERRFHTDARRFARLLVSEIKLYNEQKVKEGRAAGDLYDRLREEIDRSRQMYDKRVAPQVASRYDYFHHELINTLAEGVPAKLGADYPGSTLPT